MTIASSYFGPALARKHRHEIVKQALKDLRPHRDEFDSVVYRGNSGAVIAPIIAYLMNKHLIVCRKNEQQHSSYMMEGKLEIEKVLFIDDFIGQGNTLQEVVKKLQEFQPLAKVVGVYTYLRSESVWSVENKIMNIPYWGRSTEGPGYYADPQKE